MPKHDRTELGRRGFLQVVAGLAGTSVIGCKKTPAVESLACTDVSTLAEPDRAARETAGYADRCPDPAKQCDACRYFVSTGAGCGGCKLVRGPVHPMGTCRVFAPRA
jgi:hypothetical protein